MVPAISIIAGTEQMFSKLFWVMDCGNTFFFSCTTTLTTFCQRKIHCFLFPVCVQYFPSQAPLPDFFHVACFSTVSARSSHCGCMGELENSPKEFVVGAVCLAGILCGFTSITHIVSWTFQEWNLRTEPGVSLDHCSLWLTPGSPQRSHFCDQNPQPKP